MLGDEVQEKAIKLTYKGVRVTAEAITNLIRQYLSIDNQTYGKQHIKKLNRKGRALDSIPVIDKDLRGMQRELNKLGVDYSIVKSTEENTYDIYFKGSDINQINTALKTYIKNSVNLDRESIYDRIKKAIQKAKERNEQNRQKEKKIDKGRDER